MAIDKKSLKKMFPNLYNELESSDNKVSISAIRKNIEEAEDFAYEKNPDNEALSRSGEISDKLRHFNPQATDFLRRCDTEAQAEEIIMYLQKRGEITIEYAQELRCQLKKEGVRSFGPKKEENHYFKEGGIC